MCSATFPTFLSGVSRSRANCPPRPPYSGVASGERVVLSFGVFFFCIPSLLTISTPKFFQLVTVRGEPRWLLQEAWPVNLCFRD